jgi:hypothetical protein
VGVCMRARERARERILFTRINFVCVRVLVCYLRYACQKKSATYEDMFLKRQAVGRLRVSMPILYVSAAWPGAYAFIYTCT